MSSDRGEAGNRRRAIRSLIQERKVGSQAELVDQLRQQGYVVTQATVSRDIKEMQLIKVPMDDGRYKYALPAVQPRVNATQKLRRTLADNFVSVDHAENLIVMKCLPGTANAVAALIDQLDWPGLMGTVSGDDTILIIARKKEDAGAIAARFVEIIV